MALRSQMDVRTSLPISLEPLGLDQQVWEQFLARSVNGTLFHDLRFLRYYPENQIALRADAPVTRNGVIDRLHAMGVPTRRGIIASHLEPPCRSMGVALPNTEMLAEPTLQLPMHPALEPAQQERVLAALDAAVQVAELCSP
jgi:DegT/DnrJ/EryC1/StrS aminotransferase family